MKFPVLLFLISHAAAVTVVPADTIFPGLGGCRDSTYNRCIDGGDLGAVCTPLGDGSHTCTCSAGYQLYSDGICKPAPDACNSSNWDNGNYMCSVFGDVPGTCVPDPSTKLGYICNCPAGSYEGYAQLGGCFADPCNTPNNPCNGGTCTPQNGDSSTGGYPFMCTACPAGTIFFGGTCQDPCAVSPCTVCTVSLSTATGYTCVCPTGQIYFNADCVDPCNVTINGNTGNNFCSMIDTKATCYVLPATPSYEECACSPGFKSVYDPTVELKTCVDINECTEVVAACGPDVNAICTNTVGSFSCICSTGFNNTGGVCVDVDECATTPNPCAANGDTMATCTNTLGSYTCTCSTGFSYAMDLNSCVDVNECTKSFLPCGINDLNAVCTNSIGSFSCNCSTGFKSVNQVCVPVGKCSTLLNPCGEADPKALCVDVTPTTYTCTCSQGFQFVASEGKCLPTPVCSTNSKDCKGKKGKGCKTKTSKGNSSGSSSAEGDSAEDTKATCTCPLGFLYDGKICRDTNECLIAKSVCARKCKSKMIDTCENTVGGYRCTCRDAGICDSGRKGKVSKIRNSKIQKCDCYDRFPYSYYYIDLKYRG